MFLSPPFRPCFDLPVIFCFAFKGHKPASGSPRRFFTFILLDEGVSAFPHHLCRMLEDAWSFQGSSSFFLER